MRIIAFFCFLFMFSCSTIIVKKNTLLKVIKGNIKASNQLKYSFQIESKKPFTIDSLIVKNSREILQLYYKDALTSKTSYVLLKPFPKGKYDLYFDRDVSNTNNEFLDVELFYSIEGSRKKKFIFFDKISKIQVNR